MRFHARYPLLQLWLPRSQALMRRENLAFARFEPVLTDGVHGAGLLDLVFTDGICIAVLPFVSVQSTFLLQRERTPVIWPSAARILGYDTLDALEDEILPWLQARALARQENEEVLREFARSEIRETVRAAREAGFLGAARYDDLLPAFAPYIYAARFSQAASVCVQDESGANGAVFLSAIAQSVRADLRDAARNDLAASWFGLNLFGDATGDADVAIGSREFASRAHVASITLDARNADSRIVEVASAVPADILVSFDPEDAPLARVFSVRSNVQMQSRPATPAPSAEAAGGSSGTILMLMREDFERAPDADVDEARNLASRLRAEGFTVELRSPSQMQQDDRADLVHAFGVSDPATPPVLQRMRDRGVPVVANANLGATPQEAAWGPNIMSALFARAADESLLEEYLDLVALRRLSSEQSAIAASASHSLKYVDVALVCGAAEEGALREREAFTGEAVHYTPAGANSAVEADDITTLTGTKDFAFAHAPIDWRTNAPLLARIAAARGIPLVLAGPVVDVACLRYALAAAPEFVIHVPNPTEGELEALYRAARLYADVSWSPKGLSRLVRAARSGCRLLLSKGSFAPDLWPSAPAADPGSLQAIDAAFAQAWNAPPSVNPPAGPDLFAASILAYFKAIAARAPA